MLVAVSGGASSITLLHLIHSGLIQNSHKRLCFKPTFLHIDGWYLKQWLCVHTLYSSLHPITLSLILTRFSIVNPHFTYNTLCFQPYSRKLFIWRFRWWCKGIGIQSVQRGGVSRILLLYNVNATSNGTRTHSSICLYWGLYWIGTCVCYHLSPPLECFSVFIHCGHWFCFVY